MWEIKIEPFASILTKSYIILGQNIWNFDKSTQESSHLLTYILTHILTHILTYFVVMMTVVYVSLCSVTV